jgi:integrase
MKGLRAALNAAASADPRIANNAAWRVGLKSLPVGDTARRIVLPDADVGCIVTAAYEIDRAFGLFVEVLATTGARASQAARLTVGDLQADRAGLMVPTSKKGGRRAAGKKIAAKPVPIPAGLAALLQDASKGRPADAQLLVRGDGGTWDGSEHQRQRFRDAVTRAKLDPDTITPYALRHSSIVRMLLRNTPIRVVAAVHDTSTVQIEKHYSAFIADFADSIARSALLDFSPPLGDNIVPLAREPVR